MRRPLTKMMTCVLAIEEGDRSSNGREYALPASAVPVVGNGIDLDALLATAHSALEAADTSTLLDITDGEERIRFYVA